MPDGKEKPVGKDSVPKVNFGGRHWPDHVGFGGAECHSCNKVAILHGSVNGAAGSQEMQIISNHQLKKKVWPTHYSHCTCHNCKQSSNSIGLGHMHSSHTTFP